MSRAPEEEIGYLLKRLMHLFRHELEQRLREACAALGLRVTAWFDSPIAGGDGNREFFIAAVWMQP